MYGACNNNLEHSQSFPGTADVSGCGIMCGTFAVSITWLEKGLPTFLTILIKDLFSPRHQLREIKKDKNVIISTKNL